ncbi:hypothetical protein FQN54_000436 [Arachnomyces sp. PD_36]|nr:hypothetical protein FQN54_000436 [Arachnomyces sp. PD_36]
MATLPKTTTLAGNIQANPSISGVNHTSSQQPKKTPPATAHRHRISLEDDHEIYLQLMAGENKEAVEKTANQLQLEERARLLDRRARDPAVTDPEGAPGPVDFECAEWRERSSSSSGVGVGRNGAAAGAGVGVNGGGGGGSARGKGR